MLWGRWGFRRLKVLKHDTEGFQFLVQVSSKHVIFIVKIGYCWKEWTNVGVHCFGRQNVFGNKRFKVSYWTSKRDDITSGITIKRRRRAWAVLVFLFDVICDAGLTELFEERRWLMISCVQGSTWNCLVYPESRWNSAIPRTSWKTFYNGNPEREKDKEAKMQNKKKKKI